MKRLRHFFPLPVLVLSLLYSQNLVPNPSFEVYTAWPSSWGQLTNCTPWINGSGTCDFMHACASTASYRTPTNNFGTQTPSTGSGYIGLVTMTNFGWYEHAGVPLISPLIAGTTYNVSMNVSLADVYPQYMCNRIGFLFTNSGADPGVPGTAHVFTASVVSSNTTWTTISGTFTPATSYTHVFIGSFFPWASMTNNPTGYGSYPSGYYYFDDISVTPVGPLDQRKVELAEPVSETAEVELTWHTVGLTNISRFEIEQSLDAENFSLVKQVSGNVNSISEEPVKWNLPVYYRVRAIDADGNTFTSNIRSSTSFAPSETSVQIFPNPVSNSVPFTVRIGSGTFGSAQIQLYNIGGSLINRVEVPTGIGFTDVQIPSEGLAPGIYILHIQTSEDSYAEKFEVQ